ncbi:hypothetical protein ACO2WH_25880, partial [Escherichia coli]|uniref:hypothetical protein n=1 Tax=Escherichia coli TaxID=562 RepID=UPI003C085683
GQEAPTHSAGQRSAARLVTGDPTRPAARRIARPGPMPATIRQAHAAISCCSEISGQNYSDGPGLEISKKVSKQHW